MTVRRSCSACPGPAVREVHIAADGVRTVQVVTTSDVNIEELTHKDIAPDDALRLPGEDGDQGPLQDA